MASWVGLQKPPDQGHLSPGILVLRSSGEEPKVESSSVCPAVLLSGSATGPSPAGAAGTVQCLLRSPRVRGNAPCRGCQVGWMDFSPVWILLIFRSLSHYWLPLVEWWCTAGSSAGPVGAVVRAAGLICQGNAGSWVRCWCEYSRVWLCSLLDLSFWCFAGQACSKTICDC